MVLLGLSVAVALFCRGCCIQSNLDFHVAHFGHLYDGQGSVCGLYIIKPLDHLGAYLFVIGIALSTRLGRTRVKQYVLDNIFRSAVPFWECFQKLFQIGLDVDGHWLVMVHAKLALPAIWVEAGLLFLHTDLAAILLAATSASASAARCRTCSARDRAVYAPDNEFVTLQAYCSAQDASHNLAAMHELGQFSDGDFGFHSSARYHCRGPFVYHLYCWRLVARVMLLDKLPISNASGQVDLKVVIVIAANREAVDHEPEWAYFRQVVSVKHVVVIVSHCDVRHPFGRATEFAHLHIFDRDRVEKLGL